jgi:hypothetical protein
MIKMGFKIIRDYYYEREAKHDPYYSDNNKGKERDYHGGNIRCKVYDDDGELYYEALCDGESGAEMFHNWAMVDSGCTASKIKTDDTWEWFIG